MRETLFPHLPKIQAPLYPHAPKSKAKGTGTEEIYIARDSSAYDTEEGHPALPKGVRFPVEFHEVKAVIDGIGHITYTYYPSLKIGYIEMINIGPHYQGRGFGSKLLQFAIDEMKKHGIVKVSTSIWSEEGETLFKAHGFSYVDDLMVIVYET